MSIRGVITNISKDLDSVSNKESVRIVLEIDTLSLRSSLTLRFKSEEFKALGWNINDVISMDMVLL